MFDGGAYDLSEVSFKLGMLRIVIIDRGPIADQVEGRRAVAVLRLKQRFSHPIR